MENRDRDKLNKNGGSIKGSELNRDASFGASKNKNDSTNFGQNIQHHTELNDQPSGRVGKQGSSGMKGSGKSDVKGDIKDKDVSGERY